MIILPATETSIECLQQVNVEYLYLNCKFFMVKGLRVCLFVFSVYKKHQIQNFVSMYIYERSLTPTRNQFQITDGSREGFAWQDSEA